MKKRATPLGMSAFPIGRELTLKDWEYPKGFRCQWYHYENVYADKLEMDAIRHFIRYLIEKDPSYPDRIAEKVYMLADTITNRTVTIPESMEGLLHAFRENFMVFARAVGMLSFRGPIQLADILDEKVLSMLMFKLGKDDTIREYDRYKEALRIPIRPSIVYEEQQFLAANKDRKDTDAVIAEYRERFAFLRYHWFIGEELSDVQILDKLKNAEEVTPTEVPPLKIFGEEQHIVRQLQEWIYLRTYIKDLVNLMAYKMRPLLRRIADKKGIAGECMPYLTYHEILKIEETDSESLLSKSANRSEGYSAQTIDDDLVFGDFGKPPEPGMQSAIIRGQPAYKGKVTGIVKVMQSPDDTFDADILVVGMTTPDYLHHMKKAKAFVTDEGGITCHAAIVSRELRIPCIVGAQNATRVLKDGDVVEVDADKGIVKRL